MLIKSVGKIRNALKKNPHAISLKIIILVNHLKLFRKVSECREQKSKPFSQWRIPLVINPRLKKKKMFPYILPLRNNDSVMITGEKYGSMYQTLEERTQTSVGRQHSYMSLR